jgi:IS30 family transposase
MKKEENKHKTRGKGRKYKHIDQFERDRIEAMLNHGYKQTNIANILGRDKSSISREISKNRQKIRNKGGTFNGEYRASQAHHKAYVRRKYSKCHWKKINKDNDLFNYVVGGLRQYWSPDEILGRMKKDKEIFYVSKTAIYD